PYNGPWTKKEVGHLLRRTMFGAAYKDIDFFSNKSLTDTVDELLTVNTPPLPPLNYYGADTGAAIGETWHSTILMQIVIAEILYCPGQ
ncbi:MAG TPA: hypothetical protein PK611_02605, partial [Saprospiraceae bacterium]|nr:hypothetical protein [Saprospiraceae bacterium]